MRLVLLACVLALAALGCGAGLPSPLSKIDTPSNATPPAPAVEEQPLPSEIAYAISQRKVFGLRADEAWVRAVAIDPRARVDPLDFLMLPEEATEFLDRQADFEEAALAAQAYGESHAGEFGGVWIEQERHTVVTAWTANPELHRIAILTGLGQFARLEARLVHYPEADLRALQDRMTEDRDWLRGIPAVMTFSSVDIMSNQAELGISSANPAAAAQILAHYGVPPDKLRVSSDGTGILLQPRGTVHGRVRLAGGGEPGRNDWILNWVADHPTGGDCGAMVGYGVSPDGAFELPCAPGAWTISVQQLAGDAWVDIGAAHVVVPAGGDVDVTVEVDPAKAEGG